MDRFVGPGATPAELLLQFVPTLILAFGWVGFALYQGMDWTWWQLLLAWILVVDMVGGVITNATNAGKRWYHRPGQGFRQHLGFVLLHAFQPAVIVLAFDWGNLTFFIGSFGYLLGATLCLLTTPLYLQRPLAGLLVVIGCFLGLYVLPVPIGFEWFVPVYCVKVLSSHLVKEAPFRPSTKN